MLDLISWIVLGGLAGWAASVVMGRRQQGCVTDVVVGIVGAFVGGAVINVIQGEGFRLTGELSLDAGSLFTAFIGAVVLLALLRVLR